ncbi:MAG: AAA family ATPase [Kiritimatiellae bacterium]|nr:AAA family ATPase [Kiritimatiellia bacterium]
MQEPTTAEAAREEKTPSATLPISGDTVKKALARKLEQGEITQEQSELLWWYFAWCKNNEYSLSIATRELGFNSNSTLSRAWGGTYGAKLDNVTSRIERYKKIAIGRAISRRTPFVETSIWKRVRAACDAAAMSNTIVFIYGNSQIGKTTALEEYTRRNNHGQTKYVRMPVGGVQIFMKEMARACFVSTTSCFERLRERVLNAIDDRTLVIIDEAHQCFLSYQHGSQVKVMEVIREIYDRTKCGMVLCGTNVFRHEIQEGAHAKMLEQLRLRCTHPIQLPNKPPAPDLERIAKAFNLPAPKDQAQEIIKEMIHKSGLGMYVKYLQAAARMAGQEKKRLTWDHFVQTHDIIAKLSK